MKKLFFLAAMSLLSCQLFAQIPAGRPGRPAAAPLPPPLVTREVSGKVIDGTGQGVPGVNLILSSKSDTIKIATNADGVFVFHDVKQATFNINATSVGFIPYVGHFQMNDVAKRIVMDPITLKDESKELTTVNINGTPSITYKTDTVEYRASDYKVRENSTVDELLKHMEGFEVGSDGSVTHQGQAVTKARLNGKDYAGGDIAQAIQSLPADIVEKIQVVDDYGDQAARTGIKDGDPTKVLNITTLANKSIGNIGRATVQEGSNDRINDILFLNRINANQVIALNSSLANSVNGVNNNGAAGSGTGSAGGGGNTGQGGTTTNGRANFSYRDQLNKTTQINGSYQYTLGDSFVISSSNSGQFNQLGTTVDTSNSVSHKNSYGHRFTFDYEVQPDSQHYIRIEPNYNYTYSLNSSDGSSNSVGLSNQTTSSHSTNTSSSPNYGVTANYQILAKKDRRRNISLQFVNSTSKSTTTSTTNSHILYRSTTGVPVLDSLIDRVIPVISTNYSDAVTLQYVQPLTKVGLPVQQRLEFNESYTYRGYDYDKVTNNVNSAGGLNKVDSLSNLYNYSFSQINLAVNYNRQGAKSQLTLGARVLSTSLDGNNVSRGTSTHRNDFYVLPVFRYQYQWTRTEQIAVNYNGRATEPTFQEIQPVPDYSSNPQNPIFGNPNLKPSFTHTITTRYNDYIANSKFNFSLNSNTSYTQDQITQNNVLVEQLITRKNPITGVTTQSINVVNETHYLNVSGAKSENLNYSIAKQLNDRAYNLEFNGGVTYGYSPVFSNNQEFHQTTWDVNERFGPIITPNTSMDFRPYISYDDHRTFSTIPSYNALAQTGSDVKTTAIDVQGRFFLGKEKRFTLSYEFIKNYITGIQGYNKNPFVTNAYIDYEFFAKKNGQLRLSAFDIFDQNVFLNHTQSPTGYTNTLSNALSRYFQVSFILNLQKFSGRPERNGQPMRRRGDGSFIVD